MIARRLRRLIGDRRGVALIEFAIVLPFLIVLFFGGYQLTDAMACKRRVTIMARAMGDLTSQYRQLTGDEMDTLLAAATQIMAPYSADPAQIRVSQITVEPNGLFIRVDWSRARNTRRFASARYWATKIPAAYRQPNMTFIWTQTSYDYTTALSKYFDSTSFSQDIWLLPRRSSTITLS